MVKNKYKAIRHISLRNGRAGQERHFTRPMAQDYFTAHNRVIRTYFSHELCIIPASCSWRLQHSPVPPRRRRFILCTPNPSLSFSLSIFKMRRK
jgi:hypothetical protein